MTTVVRDRQRLASRAHVSQALPGSVLRCRLELLADTESSALAAAAAAGRRPAVPQQLG